MPRASEATFRKSAEILRKNIEDNVSRHSAADLADGSINVPRQVLERYESKVDDLFAALLDLHRDMITDLEDQNRYLRRAVLGDGAVHSRAKILAIVLAAEIPPASPLWGHFIRRLGTDDGSKAGPKFLDSSLPFSDSDWGSYFGGEHIERLQGEQHPFCPVDTEIRFSEIRKHLKDKLESEDNPTNLHICEFYDIEGKDLCHTREGRFCPDGVAQTIVDAYRDLVKRLHIEACKSRDLVKAQSDREKQRAIVEAAESESIKFYEGVQSRSKIFASIILSDVEAGSTTWSNFTKICFSDSPGIHDNDLPIPYHVIETCLGREHVDVLDLHQYRFCAVNLKPKDQVTDRKNKRLPLLEKRKLGSGAFGQVYRVKVAAGFYTPDIEELAMKEMRLITANLGEWDDAQWLFQQQHMHHDSIMRAVACLKTPEKIYIFFPLASCNLRQYMMKGPEFGLPAGPANNEERLKCLQPIMEVAHALQYLQQYMVESEAQDRVLCIHEDLKAENILVSRTSDAALVFQITDFGISSIKHRPKGSDAWEVVNRNQMYHSEPRSLRDMKTKTALGSDCPNFAPEARNKERQVDSKVDVWAFGTVFAEYVAWLSGGADALNDYDRHRGGGGTPDEADNYYPSFEIDSSTGEPRVKESIWSWFSALIEKTDQQDDKRLYRSCRDLLEHHLLVCKPEERSEIQVVRENLGHIVKQEPVTVPGLQKHQRRAAAPSRPRVTPQDARVHQPVLLPTTREFVAGEPDGSSREGEGLTRELTDSANGRYEPAPTTTSSVASPDAGSIRGNPQPEACPDSQTPVRWSSGSRPQSHATSSGGNLSSEVALSANYPPTTGENNPSMDQHGRTELLAALADGNVVLASELIERGPRLICPDSSHWTALHHAVRLDDEELVVKLLSSGVDIVNSKNDDGQTALHICAKRSVGAAVSHARRLLDCGADPNIKDRTNRSALYFATDHHPNLNRRRLVDLLLAKGAEVDGYKLGRAARHYEAVARARTRYRLCCIPSGVHAAHMQHRAGCEEETPNHLRARQPPVRHHLRSAIRYVSECAAKLWSLSPGTFSGLIDCASLTEAKMDANRRKIQVTWRVSIATCLAGSREAQRQCVATLATQTPSISALIPITLHRFNKMAASSLRRRGQEEEFELEQHVTASTAATAPVSLERRPRARRSSTTIAASQRENNQDDEPQRRVHKRLFGIAYGPELEDKGHQRIENPFSGDWTRDEIQNVAGAVAHEYGLDDLLGLFIKACRVLNDPDPDSWSEWEARDPSELLTNEERSCLLQAQTSRFWDQPWPLQTTLAMLFVAAVVQGWSQTGLNGANLSWWREIGPGDARSPPPATAVLTPSCAPDPSEIWPYAVVNAAPYLAAAVGSQFSDPLINDLLAGRRGAIMLSAVLVLAASVGAPLTRTWRQLLGCRVVLGLGMGCKAAVVPVFAAEIAPPHLRGALVMNWQVFDALGIFLGFSANLIASRTGGAAWRWQIFSSAIPSFALLCGSLFVCWDSPRHLMKQEAKYRDIYKRKRKAWDRRQKRKGGEGSMESGQTPSHGSLSFWAYYSAAISFRPNPSLPYRSEAFKTLVLLRGHPILAAKELLYAHCQLLVETRCSQSPTEEYVNFSLRSQSRWLGRYRGLFTKRYIRRELYAAAVVMIGQQLCGINVLIFYSSTLFCDTGEVAGNSEELQPLLSSWGIGLANIVFALPAYWLIDRKGRRWLLLVTLPVLAIMMAIAALGFNFHDPKTRRVVVTVFTYLFTIFYSSGMGPVPFTLSAEMFPLEHRMVGMSLAVSLNLLGAGLETLLIVPLISKPAILLWVFSGLNVLAFIFVWAFVREVIGSLNEEKDGRMTALSLEDLFWIFEWSTATHVKYQWHVALPYSWARFKYIVRLCFGLENDFPEAIPSFSAWAAERAEQRRREAEAQHATS